MLTWFQQRRQVTSSHRLQLEIGARERMDTKPLRIVRFGSQARAKLDVTRCAPEFRMAAVNKVGPSPLNKRPQTNSGSVERAVRFRLTSVVPKIATTLVAL